MSIPKIIVISPSSFIDDEAQLINELFDLGIFRYHIDKSNATEQHIAEVLEKVNPKYLNKISLHSHFHLVLAYGVGGIHYSKSHRLLLKSNYAEKVKLYQGFGISVSTEKYDAEEARANYYLDYSNDYDEQAIDTYCRIDDLNNLTTRQYFISLPEKSDDDFLNDFKRMLSI